MHYVYVLFLWFIGIYLVSSSAFPYFGNPNDQKCSERSQDAMDRDSFDLVTNRSVITHLLFGVKVIPDMK